MESIIILLGAAVIFGICYAVDKVYTRIFRSKAQHRSGLAVRASKKYGIFGVLAMVLGVLSLIYGVGSDRVLFWGGAAVLALGIGLVTIYLGFGIFYNGESFLVSNVGHRSREYTYREIVGQKLYVVTGGGIVIELQMKDGSAVSLQSSMDGVFPFLDTAFAAWCMQTGHKMEECDFYDPSKSWWFPHEEEV